MSFELFRLIFYTFFFCVPPAREHTLITQHQAKNLKQIAKLRNEKRKNGSSRFGTVPISSLFLNCCVRLCVFACRSPLRLLCKCTGLLCNMYTKQNKKKVNGYIVRSVMAFFFVFFFFVCLAFFASLINFFLQKKRWNIASDHDDVGGMGGTDWIDWLIFVLFFFETQSRYEITRVFISGCLIVTRNASSLAPPSTNFLPLWIISDGWNELTIRLRTNEKRLNVRWM